jgi:hypothetical protein
MLTTVDTGSYKLSKPVQQAITLVDYRDAYGCVFSTTVTITSGNGPTAVDITPTDAACNQIQWRHQNKWCNGGASPYEYNVDNGGYSGDTNYTNLSAGNHTVDVRDANGCVFSTTVNYR